MTGTVSLTSNTFNIKSDVRQGCVVAPTLFGKFFALLVRHALRAPLTGFISSLRSDVKLFNLLDWRLKGRFVELYYVICFVYDAAIVVQTENALQPLFDRSSASLSALACSSRRENSCRAVTQLAGIRFFYLSLSTFLFYFMGQRLPLHCDRH